MPDLMKTPSNRRYVVNFQQKEPLNKYDIWLSFNKHNLNGNIVIDSEYLSDKDLVFKVFVDGKWVPILGIPVSYEGIVQALEELDKKKMNIVPPTEWEAGDIAIFQQGSDECDQLVSGGTLEEMLQTIINDGGVIPLQRATTTQLGGVKAGLHIHNNNPDQYVEAKFKFPEGYDEGGIVENDRLYVSASEIIQAINTYTGGGGSGLDLQLMGPSTRGGAKANYVPATWDAAHYIPVLVRTVDEMLYVNIDGIIDKIVALLESGDVEIYEAGEGIDITDNVISNIQATNSTFGGIKADTHESTMDAIYGIQPKFGTDGIWDVENQTHLIDNEHLCITSTQIFAILKKIDPTTQTFPIGTESGLYGRFENIGTQLAPEYIPTLGINGVVAENVGKVPTVIPSQSSQSGYDIEWINLSSGSYSPLTSNSVAGDECVVVAPSDKTGFLRGDGQFVPVSSGSSVTITPTLFSGTKIADYSIDNTNGSLYAPTSIYYGNNGITINQNTHYIGLDLTGVRPDYILSYNGTGIEWIPQLNYTAGVGIEITNNNTINSVIEKDNNSYEATSSLVFNCVYASAQHPSGGISMIPDNTPSSGTTLDPYTYTEVTIKMVGLTAIDVRFNTATQLSFMKGDPVYVMFDLAGKNTQINISVPSADDKNWLINVNNAVITNNGNSCLDITNYSRFLCTLQFGTVKIEPLEATYSVNDDNNSQEES